MIDRISRRSVGVARGLLWFCLAALPPGLGLALAHEGHNGAPAAGVPATGAPATGLALRIAAASPDIKLLAELRKDTLLIYLDRFATNEPLSGATIEIEEGSNRATAAPVGERSVPGQRAVARPAGHPRPGFHAACERPRGPAERHAGGAGHARRRRPDPPQRLHDGLERICGSRCSAAAARRRPDRTAQAPSGRTAQAPSG